MKPIAVVSGANRGLGLETARQLALRGVRVVVTSRDEAKGQAACERLSHEGLDVLFHPLDVTRTESMRALAAFLETQHGGVDILVNNAGVSLKGFDAEIARGTLNVNFFGPMVFTDILLPLVRPHGRIVMVTSGMGDPNLLSGRLRAALTGSALDRDTLVKLMEKFIDDVRAGTHKGEGWPTNAYSVSKIGLNALTKVVARELSGDPRGILCNAGSPGWARTDMGGPYATRSVEQGAETLVWLAMLPENGPRGGIFHDKAPVAF